MPVTEDMPFAPISPYGRTKVIVEDMLRDYQTGYGMRSIVLRYFNASGADPDGETSEDRSRAASYSADADGGGGPTAAAGHRGHRLSDCRRNGGAGLIHVTDLADAHVGALRELIEGGAPDTLNLGTGKGYSVRDIVAAVERITSETIPVSKPQTPRRSGGVVGSTWTRARAARLQLPASISI